MKIPWPLVLIVAVLIVVELITTALTPHWKSLLRLVVVTVFCILILRRNAKAARIFAVLLILGALLQAVFAVVLVAKNSTVAAFVLGFAAFLAVAAWYVGWSKSMMTFLQGSEGQSDAQQGAPGDDPRPAGSARP